MRSDTVKKRYSAGTAPFPFQCTGTDGGGASEAIDRSRKFL